jgi:ATP-binding cassette subfamily B (MDR/TAP) protein 1
MQDYAPKKLAVIGFIASIAASMQLPIFGYVLSQFIFVLLENNPVSFKRQRDLWTLVFVLLCLGIGISAYIQKICFALGGENLTYTLRVKLFRALMHKNIGWYDNKARAPGVLTNVITEDISALNGLTTESLSIGVEAALGLIFSSLICFLFTW